MFARALLAFLALPGMVAGVIPLVLASVDPVKQPLVVPGVTLVVLGLVLLLWCVRDFYVAGKGTLAPWDPPARLVVVGLYRYTRNPMYVSVVTLLAGWAVFFASPLLATYTLIVAAVFHIRVRRFEEPWLAARYGAEWVAYCAATSRWLPHLNRARQ